MFWTVLSHVLAVSAWTGLSVAALVGCAFVIIYFPPFRRLAILAASFVVAIYVASMIGEYKGQRYVKAQWDAANAEVEREKQQLAADIRRQEQTRYAAGLAAERQATNNLQLQVDDYAKQLSTRVATAECRRIGPDDLKRLRNIK